jgi:hypothetical protein
MSKYILVGSNVFFSSINGFKSKDKDYVLLVDNPDGFKYFRQTNSTYDLFEWKRMTAQEFIDYSLSNGSPMQIGKFLVPEFVNEIGFTIDDLKKLNSLIDRLDDKHKYEGIIYDAYISNNSFSLTDEQRLAAYTEYKLERGIK